MFFILLYFVYEFYLWSTYSFYANLCVYDTFFTIAKVASNVICWRSNGFFVAIVPHNPMPKGQNFPHTISILAVATPLPIHCSNCLSTLWEYHTLSTTRWEYDAHSVRAHLRADAERVSYSQQAALPNNIIFFVTNWFYISFLHCPKSIARKQSTCAPTAPPASCASYLVSPPSSLHVFG
jgi:hypothetical protein